MSHKLSLSLPPNLENPIVAEQLNTSEEEKIQKNIQVHSFCEHHFVPVIGIAHVAYIPTEYLIGLSKLNRIVHYFAQRPQLQERLTEQIAYSLKQILETEDVAVYIEAKHYCVMLRGAEDIRSTTVTMHLSGKFQQDCYREKFFRAIR